MTEARPSPEAPVARSRWKGWLLFVSLALNLLFVGIVGAVVVRNVFSPPLRWGEPANIVSFTRGLPEERRRAIWLETAAERQALRPFRAEIRKRRADVRAELTSSTFDDARFRSAQERLLEAELQARKAALSLQTSVARHLTSEERHRFAQWHRMGERPHWRRWRDRGKPPHDDDEPETPAAPREPSPQENKSK